jgi:hypothetical protein
MNTITIVALLLVPVVVIAWSVLNHPIAGTLIGTLLATPPLLGLIDLQNWIMLGLGIALAGLAVWLLYLWHLFFYPSIYGYPR